jgi:hypothetical protein
LWINLKEQARNKRSDSLLGQSGLREVAAGGKEELGGCAGLSGGEEGESGGGVGSSSSGRDRGGRVFVSEMIHREVVHDSEEIPDIERG